MATSTLERTKQGTYKTDIKTFCHTFNKLPPSQKIGGFKKLVLIEWLKLG